MPHRLAPTYAGDPFSDAAYRSVATLLRQANVGWVRIEFDWGRTLPDAVSPTAAPAVRDAAWLNYDRSLNRARAV